MSLKILNITWLEKEYVNVVFKNNFIRKRIFLKRFKNTTWLEKEVGFKVFKLNWLEEGNICRDIR